MTEKPENQISLTPEQDLCQNVLTGRAAALDKTGYSANVALLDMGNGYYLLLAALQNVGFNELDRRGYGPIRMGREETTPYMIPRVFVKNDKGNLIVDKALEMSSSIMDFSALKPMLLSVMRRKKHKNMAMPLLSNLAKIPFYSFVSVLPIIEPSMRVNIPGVKWHPQYKPQPPAGFKKALP